MEKIPPQVPFDGYRIVLYGPESTGKSTLSRKLAQYYNTVYVEEYARDYLQSKFDATGRAASYDDIIPIASGQRHLENAAAKTARQYLFCDTDPLETMVYCQYYFGRVPDLLKTSVACSDYDLYLLMDIDLPWVKDDLRDRPNDRKELYKLFENALKQTGKTYSKVNGLGNARFAGALSAIAQRLKK